MTPTLLKLLQSVDTPTVCNSIEVAQGKRGFNDFTRGTMLCSAPEEPAIVGYARTAKIAAVSPPTEAPDVADNVLYDGQVADAAVKKLRDLKAADDPDPQVRSAALIALGHTIASDDLPVLIARKSFPSRTIWNSRSQSARRSTSVSAVSRVSRSWARMRSTAASSSIISAR